MNAARLLTCFYFQPAQSLETNAREISSRGVCVMGKLIFLFPLVLLIGAILVAWKSLGGRQ